MKQIHIVLDSTANVPPELFIQHPNLHTVPLKVRIGETEWDEEALSPDELFARVEKTGMYPKTSQPSPGAFEAVLRPIAEAGDEAIVIALSGALSGTAEGARAAARAVGGDRVRVVDSQTTAIGMVRLAEEALGWIGAGQTAEAICRALEEKARQTRTLFLPATLEYLHRGGRIGGAAAFFGAVFRIRPLLELEAGGVAVLDKVRTQARALQRLEEEVARSAPLAYIGVAHCGAPQEARALGLRLAERCPSARVSVTSTGAVLAAHLGPGLVGAVFQQAMRV